MYFMHKNKEKVIYMIRKRGKEMLSRQINRKRGK